MPEPAAPEGGYLDLELDELLGFEEEPAVPEPALASETEEVPAQLEAEGSRATAAGVGRFGELAEELLRVSRELEFHGAIAEVLARLQDEADSPATSDLVAAAFAAGYFAGRGELERRVGTLR